MEVEEGDDRMSEEAGDEVEGEGELASPDWRVRAGPRNRPTQNFREEHEATHVPFRDWCATLYGGHRTHPPPRHQIKGVRINRADPQCQWTGTSWT